MLGCETLAKLQLLQKAPLENLSQPVQLLEMACRSGQESACSLIHIQARPHIEKDCKEQKSASSCYNLNLIFGWFSRWKKRSNKSFFRWQKTNARATRMFLPA